MVKKLSKKKETLETKSKQKKEEPIDLEKLLKDNEYKLYDKKNNPINELCQYYIEKKEDYLTKTYSNVINGDDYKREKNIVALLKYSWNEVWSKEYHLLEEVDPIKIKKVVLQNKSLLNLNRNTELGSQIMKTLKKTFIDYGTLDNKKIEIYEKEVNENKKNMSDVFFVHINKELVESNLKKILNYGWNNSWKGKKILDEVISEFEFKALVGLRVNTKLKLNCKKYYQFLCESNNDYSKLNEEKAKFLLSWMFKYKRNEEESNEEFIYFKCSEHKEHNFSLIKKAYKEIYSETKRDKTRAIYENEFKKLTQIIETYIKYSNELKEQT
jgi:hypothetical protein